MTRAVTPIAIYGAGGFGREVLQLVRDINAVRKAFDVRGFVVDSGFDAPESIQGLPVLGGVEWLVAHGDVRIVIAVGSSAGRSRIAARIDAVCPDRYTTLVHPRAWVGEYVAIGAGSIVCAGALITTDIRIGRHVHVNIGATVGHDAVLDDFVTLNPGVSVSGNVALGYGVEVGTGSVLIPHVRVDEWSIIGAGSTVVRSLAANVTAVGAPARVIKVREHGWQDAGQS